jgi:uncharacterized protein YeaO (DUF488 family)
MSIQLKRAYDKPEKSDGYRVLIDRVWPRGVRKEDLKLDEWLRALAPSTELRRWFGHDPAKWEEFRRRYFQELDAHPGEIRKLRAKMREGSLTIVFGSREERFNNATALKEYLERRGARQRRPAGAARRTEGRRQRTVYRGRKPAPVTADI